MFFKDVNHQWKEISLERTLKYILGKTCGLFVLSCVMSEICTKWVAINFEGAFLFLSLGMKFHKIVFAMLVCTYIDFSKSSG